MTKITIDRAVLDQVLEALLTVFMPHHPAIIALRAALEQREQEPVAWRSQNATPPGGHVIFQQYPQALADLGRKIEPLYTHPPRREWRSLSDAELREAYVSVSGNEWCLGGMANAETFYEAIEAKLKERNA